MRRIFEDIDEELTPDFVIFLIGVLIGTGILAVILWFIQGAQ